MNITVRSACEQVVGAVVWVRIVDGVEDCGCDRADQ